MDALHRKREHDSHRQDTIGGCKRSRLQVNQQNCSYEGVPDLCRGETYGSVTTLIESISDSDIETIPEPVPLPPACSTLSSLERDSIIIFDLETTGFGNNSSITQIAAKHQGTGDAFSCYMKPRNGLIPSTVTQLTGLEYTGNVMFRHSQPVTCVNPTKGLQLFKDWVSNYPSPVLVAHNAHFDARVLVSNYQINKVSFPTISGFGDTIKLFRSTFPGRRSYRQELLVQDLLHKSYDTHNAVADVTMLSELVEKVPNYEDKIQVFTESTVSLKLKRLDNEKKIHHLYSPLIQKTSMSKASARALSGSGLTSDHLKLAYQRQGLGGLQSLIKTIVKRYKQLSLLLQSVFEDKELDLDSKLVSL